MGSLLPDVIPAINANPDIFWRTVGNGFGYVTAEA